MTQEMVTTYKKLSINLNMLRELYKENPNNKLLYKKINQIDKKLKTIDKSIGRSTTPGGAYNKVI